MAIGNSWLLSSHGCFGQITIREVSSGSFDGGGMACGTGCFIGAVGGGLVGMISSEKKICIVYSSWLMEHMHAKVICIHNTDAVNLHYIETIHK